jgi:hypothetical protein
VDVSRRLVQLTDFLGLREIIARWSLLKSHHLLPSQAIVFDYLNRRAIKLF